MKAWLRRLAERLSRGVVLRRRLPARFGSRRVLVTPESRLAYWRRDLGRVDPDLLRWADELVEEGMTVWDVGANVGLFSVASARRAGLAGDVVALEPDLELARLLNRSAALDAGDTEAPVTVLPLAAAADTQRMTLQVAERGRAANFVAGYHGSTQSGGSRENHQVLAVTLDWLREVLGAPHLVKIDVEGGELAVLRGARQLLREQRPSLLVEVSKRNRSEVGTLLEKAGYQLFDATAPGLAAGEPLSSPKHETLCVHSDRLPETRE